MGPVCGLPAQVGMAWLGPKRLFDRGLSSRRARAGITISTDQGPTELRLLPLLYSSPIKIQ
ncbi:hypothetical protein, partial [Methylobacterium iners]|uniref:hypothetical protein n=1 Tax=Methylobacterium iners TaxID=418707 RepID=UPI001EE21364